VILVSIARRKDESQSRPKESVGVMSTDTCPKCGELECDCFNDILDDSKDILYEPEESKMSEIEKLAREIESIGRINKTTHQLEFDLFEMEILYKHINKREIEARIEENKFYTRCPDKKIMNDAAKYRIVKLEQELKA